VKRGDRCQRQVRKDLLLLADFHADQETPKGGRGNRVEIGKGKRKLCLLPAREGSSKKGDLEARPHKLKAA